MAKSPTKLGKSAPGSKARDGARVETGYFRHLKKSDTNGGSYFTEKSSRRFERELYEKVKASDTSVPVARGPRVEINAPASSADREATFDEAMQAIKSVMDENDELMRRLA